jgi:hypothetical protein
MTIRDVTYYVAECDGCGTRAEYGDFSAMSDPGEAEYLTVFNAESGGYSACPCESAEEHDEKWHAAVVDARRSLEAAVPAIRQQVYDELGHDHYVIFTEDRWTIEHSVECRLSGQMHECAIHRAISEAFWGAPDPDQFGRWRVVSIDGAGGWPQLERAEIAP